MFYEISVEANQLIEQSLLGKEQVTRNALRPIRRMRDKLDGLGFLDHRVAPIVSTIDDLLVRIPTKGAIEGPILQAILATAMLLSDPDKTRRHGEGLLVHQTPVVEETDVDEIVDHAELEPPTVLTATTVTAEPTPVIAASASVSPDFTDLFDGIFDDELEAESSADNWALESLLNKSQAELEISNQNDESNPSTHSAELETVTAGDDDEMDNSDQDYWF
jgi:hypothetical protein